MLANWPPGDASTLPGGITVFNNKIYILGGYDVLNGIGSDQIWEFTPNPAGWVQKSAVLPFPLGYIPTTTIGSLIYTGGGADITGGVLTDTNHAFVYDPVADSISTIADIPTPTSDVRGLNFCNQLYVMGGGGFPNTLNIVQIYDPVSNTWSMGTPFVNARRNPAADTDGTNNIWLAGGLDPNLVALASMEIFNCPVSPCGTRNSDANSYSYGYGNCHGDRNSHTHADGDANIDTVRRKMFSDTAASPDSSASPVSGFGPHS